MHDSFNKVNSLYQRCARLEERATRLYIENIKLKNELEVADHQIEDYKRELAMVCPSRYRYQRKEDVQG